MVRMILLGLATIIAGFSIPASAQAPAPEGTPVRLRGAIEALTNDTMTVATIDGQKITLALPADIRVTTFARIKLSDIKPGDFVGSAHTVKDADGKFKALEVHVFPEALRGAGEGQRPWDLPNSLMTNGAVSGVATSTSGQTLKIEYKGGMADVEVGPNTPVVALIPNGDKSILKTGAAVIVGGRKKADGTYTATSIQAEKDGVKPPL